MAEDRSPGAKAANREAVTAGEADLVRRTARGDGAAFRALVRAHLPTLLVVARRILRDDAEAEDVAQEALLRLWRDSASIDVGSAGVRPWLRRVVSNLSIDRIRVRRSTDVTDAPPDRPEPPSQLRALEQGDLGRIVNGALEALPERQRQALALFHYEGLSQREVGAALGVSDEAVESLLSRARRALKSRLAGAWRQEMPEEPT